MDRVKEIFQTYSVNATFDYDEKTAVFFANHMSPKAMRWLVEQGAVMDARNNKGENPMEYMLSKSFVFHHYGADNSDKVLETKEALQRLLELFCIFALPTKRTYDGKAKIIAKPGSWQEEFEELFLWILSPPLEGKAGTVQGELLRLSEYFYRMIRKNGITDEWSRPETRLILHAFLYYLHMGNPLSKEDCKEVKCVIREILHGEKTLRPEKLCEYSVHWIRKNPDPIRLRIIFYIP